MKIKSIKFVNFKQFASFSISCRDMNTLVGPNNAGKSTILDALRLTSDVLRHAYRHNPIYTTQEIHGVCPTYTIQQSVVSISTIHVVKNYGDDDAEVAILHENGNTLFIRLHPQRPITAFLKANGPAIRTASSFRKAFPLNIVIVPTLGPLETREAYVTDGTVIKNENTRLAHRSFRNIILRKTSEEFEDFASLVNQAWQDVEIKYPEIVRDPDAVLEMFYTEGRMTREVSTSGFGFQVWMQMMLQIMRGKPDSLLVLDEPDIYLHPDLQRKLLKLIRKRFGQTFIATHSTEIINELNPGDILSVNGKRSNARRVTSEDGYREVFAYIGSSENAEFARMARARRIVFFEGKDKKILRKFAQKLSRREILDDPDTVFLQTGGFGQWRRVREVGWTLGHVFGMNVKIAALFDRDYRCDDEVKSFAQEMNSSEIRCHFLRRKEIENYALHLDALSRLLIKKAGGTSGKMNVESANNFIMRLVDGMESAVKSQIIGNLILYRKRENPKLHETSIVSEALNLFDAAWSENKARLNLVPGKELISNLSSAFHAQYKQSITISQIIDEMHSSEISDDLSFIIKDIEDFFSDDSSLR